MSEEKSKSVGKESRIKILVINDGPILSEALTFLQDRRQSFRFFQEHASTVDSLEAMGSNEFDVVIIDTSVDVKSAVDIADRIRTNHPETPIITLCLEDERNNTETEYITRAHDPAVEKAIAEMLRALDYADSLLRCRISGFTISMDI